VNDPNPLTINPGDRVAVTGAAGFIGSSITRQLIERGALVVAGVEPGGDERNLEGLPVERRVVDVRNRDDVHELIEGCRFTFHVAAIYGFWAKDPSVFYDVNVGGTRNVLEATVGAHCERVVYTSTVGVIGLDETAAGGLASERSYADIAHLFGLYKRSKYVGEHEVLRAAAEGAPVSLALPTFPVGPRDRRPTPTGKLVLDFLLGKMPAYVDTSLNVEHVDDLARGHLEVLERGRVGRSYILGGENLNLSEVLDFLAECTGLPAPRFQVPKVFALAAGHVSDTVQARVFKREPAVPLEAARMSTTHMRFDDSRARNELGYTSRPSRDALRDSARWFVENGYVGERRRARIVWAEDHPSP
jgi:dihydroflavonol-4-reductase